MTKMFYSDMCIFVKKFSQKSFPKKCLFESSIFRLFGYLPIFHARAKPMFFSDFLISHNVRKSHFLEKQNRILINKEGFIKTKYAQESEKPGGTKLQFFG